MSKFLQTILECSFLVFVFWVGAILIFPGCSEMQRGSIKSQVTVEAEQPIKEPKSVCIIDTGVYKRHRKFKGRIKAKADCTGEGVRDVHKWAHGTSTAGIFALNTDWDLYICKSIKGRQGRGYSSRSACCVRWCAKKGVDLISMSFGSTSPSKLLHREIKKAKAAGIGLDASIGNRGNDYGEKDFNKCSYPGLFKEVWGIGSLNYRGLVAEHTSKGCTPYGYALGIRIRTLKRGGGYSSCTGTSCAAPLWGSNIGKVLP